MKFKNVLHEKIISDKGIKLDSESFAFFYDITNSTEYELKREIKDCTLSGPVYGNAIRFIVDNENKKFIIFRPDCLHYKVASQLGYQYPKNINVLFGAGIVDLSVSTKITDVDFSVFEEMPRNKEFNKFFEKVLGHKKWGWTNKYGDIEYALFNSVMNTNYWGDQKQRHYE